MFLPVLVRTEDHCQLPMAFSAPPAEKDLSMPVNMEARSRLSPVAQTHGGEPAPRGEGPHVPRLQG